MELKKPKYNWYETDEFVVVDILIKGINEQKMNLELKPQQLEFNYKTNVEDNNNDQAVHYQLILNLNDQIIPSESKWKVNPFKVEIKMRKSSNFRWQKLEMADNTNQSQINPMVSDTKTKVWDNLVKQIEKEEEEEEENKDDVSDLFKKIYSKADDNTRRAMKKSFLESNGTVLSTNWNEVGKGKVEEVKSSKKSD